MKIEQLKLFTDITRPEKNNTSLPILNSVAICPTGIFTNNLEFYTYLHVDTGLNRNIIVDAESLKDKLVMLSEVSEIERDVELLNLEDYPTPAIYTDTVDTIILSRDEFIKQFPTLKAHVSIDETKQFLQGVQVDKDSYLIATNGFSLAIYEPYFVNTLKDSFIIPIKPLDNLYKILKKDKSIRAITINYSSKTKLIQIVAGNWTIISRLIPGIFPNYMNVLPKNTTGSITFDCKQFVINLKKLLPVAKKRTNVVDIIGNSLVVKGYDRVTDPITKKETSIRNKTKDVEIKDCIINNFTDAAFNISILLYMLKNLTGELSLAGNDELSPFIVKSGSLTQIIMPIRHANTK